METKFPASRETLFRDGEWTRRDLNPRPPAFLEAWAFPDSRAKRVLYQPELRAHEYERGIPESYQFLIVFSFVFLKSKISKIVENVSHFREKRK